MSRAEPFTQADLDRAVRWGQPGWTGYIDGDGSIVLHRKQEKCSGFVYFIACGPYIKIGYTRRGVKKRLEDFRTSNPFPLHICLTLEASKWPERVLHWRFTESHHAREWFHLTDEIKHFIKKNGGTLP